MQNEHKVRPGEELAISAETWNSIIDMLRDWKRNRSEVGAVRFSSSCSPALTALVKNATGDPIYESYAVVRIDDFGLEPTAETKFGYGRRPILNGNVPDNADDPIAILQGPVGEGAGSLGSGVTPAAMVVGVVQGLSLVRVLLNDPADLWANPVPGVTDYMESSSTCGAAEILDWIEEPYGSGGSVSAGSGPDLVLALVRLQGKPCEGGSGGGSLRVRETDGSPDLSTVTMIQVPPNTAGSGTAGSIWNFVEGTYTKVGFVGHTDHSGISADTLSWKGTKAVRSDVLRGAGTVYASDFVRLSRHVQHEVQIPGDPYTSGVYAAGAGPYAMTPPFRDTGTPGTFGDGASLQFVFFSSGSFGSGAWQVPAQIALGNDGFLWVHPGSIYLTGGTPEEPYTSKPQGHFINMGVYSHWRYDDGLVYAGVTGTGAAGDEFSGGICVSLGAPGGGDIDGGTW